MFYEEESTEPDDMPLIVDLSDIGRQIKEAEERRNHIEFGKLGEHLDALTSSLSQLSKSSD